MIGMGCRKRPETLQESQKRQERMEKLRAEWEQSPEYLERVQKRNEWMAKYRTATPEERQAMIGRPRESSQ